MTKEIIHLGNHETSTQTDRLNALALTALEVIRRFPGGTLTPQEVDQLAVAILNHTHHPIPDWRVKNP
jgi:hypothetical protein